MSNDVPEPEISVQRTGDPIADASEVAWEILLGFWKIQDQFEHLAGAAKRRRDAMPTPTVEQLTDAEILWLMPPIYKRQLDEFWKDASGNDPRQQAVFRQALNGVLAGRLGRQIAFMRADRLGLGPDATAILELADLARPWWATRTLKLQGFIDGDLGDSFARASLLLGQRVKFVNFRGKTIVAASLHEAVLDLGNSVIEALTLANLPSWRARAIEKDGGDPESLDGRQTRASTVVTAIANMRFVGGHVSTLRGALRREKVAAMELSGRFEKSEEFRVLTRQKLGKTVGSRPVASARDMQRWNFAKPLREKSPQVTWAKIAEVWNKTEGEDVSEEAFRKSCNRAMRAESM